VLAVEAEQGTRLVGDEDGAGRTVGAGLQVSIGRERELDEGVHAGDEFEAKDEDTGAAFGDDLEDRLHGRGTLGQKKAT
jgi:hypothetical protein